MNAETGVRSRECTGKSRGQSNVTMIINLVPSGPGDRYQSTAEKISLNPDARVAYIRTRGKSLARRVAAPPPQVRFVRSGLVRQQSNQRRTGAHRRQTQINGRSWWGSTFSPSPTPPVRPATGQRCLRAQKRRSQTFFTRSPLHSRLRFTISPRDFSVFG